MDNYQIINVASTWLPIHFAQGNLSPFLIVIIGNPVLVILTHDVCKDVAI